MIILKKNQLLQFNYQGILRCARYAFMPNRLNFCGPDKNKELFNYCQSGQIDQGLNLILKEFQTLYPYLKFIARANQLKDPFDERVVEAYWLGNELLDNNSLSRFYYHLLDEQQLKKKLDRKNLKRVVNKISLGARPHHSFHVLNVWKRTGHDDIWHTLNTMDLCRISWGRIKKIKPPELEVEYQPLILENNQLKLGPFVSQKVLLELERGGFVSEPKKGQWVSFHWGLACEVLNIHQVKNLKKYTEESIRLANEV